jgi:hypothetical protein
MLNDNKIDELINVIQDCNINFLVGSGISRPFLAILGNIEKLLTDVELSDLNNELKKIITASIYRKYFDDVIINNLEIIINSSKCQKVLNDYKNLLTSIINLISKRKNTLLSKQVNIFTTNIDIFFEKASEDLQIECNDGFKGRFDPMYEVSDFKKSYFKRSLQYENSSEIPVVNLIKIHGSLTWKTEKGRIYYSDLKILKYIKGKKFTESYFTVDDKSTFDSIKLEIKDKDVTLSKEINEFLESYKELAIINPTKQKFEKTILDETYYELLRIYSNELEKENSVLFIMGFSMSDEHIRNLTIRVAKSNPTLKIYIICHDSKSKNFIETNIKNYSEVIYNNIDFISPSVVKLKDTSGNEYDSDEYKFDLYNINEKIFSPIYKKINLK